MALHSVPQDSDGGMTPDRVYFGNEGMPPPIRKARERRKRTSPARRRQRRWRCARCCSVCSPGKPLWSGTTPRLAYPLPALSPARFGRSGWRRIGNAAGSLENRIAACPAPESDHCLGRSCPARRICVGRHAGAGRPQGTTMDGSRPLTAGTGHPPRDSDARGALIRGSRPADHVASWIGGWLR